jgi:transcriptional regulator with XRE-family HTH domain
MTEAESIGRAIRVFAIRRGKTARDLAKELDINNGLFSRMLNGHRPMKPETLERIAEVLGCPVHTLEDEALYIRRTR